jgi:hypothetical protein
MHALFLSFSFSSVSRLVNALQGKEEGDEEEREEEEEEEREEKEHDHDQSEGEQDHKEKKERKLEKMKDSSGSEEEEEEEESEEEEIELPDLTDEEMFKYDFKLEETFRIARRQLRKKKDEKTLLMHFTLRVMDFIEIYIDNTRGQFGPSFRFVVPLLSIVLRTKGERERGEKEGEKGGGGGLVEKQNVLVEKAKKVLSKLNKTKAKSFSVADDSSCRECIRGEISSLLQLVQSSSSSSLLSSLSLSTADVVSLSVMSLSRVLRSAFAARASVERERESGGGGERDDWGVFTADDLCDAFSTPITTFLTKKNSRFHAQFFIQLFQRFPKHFAVLSPALLSCSSLSPTPFLLRSLYDLLSVFLLHHKTIGNQWVRSNLGPFVQSIGATLTRCVLTCEQFDDKDKGEEEDGEEEGEGEGGEKEKEGPKYNSKRILNLLSFCEHLSVCAIACELTENEEKDITILKDILQQVKEKCVISQLVQVWD